MPKSKSEINNNQSRPRYVLLLVGILFIAINLRPTLAAVGPLINHIRQATGLSNSMLGLLTTLPLIAFGVVSTLTPLFTRRFGIGGTLLGAMLLLVLGIGIRSLDGTFLLYFGTLLLGIAIAFGNVLLPGLTKRNFSSNSGYITSLYSSVMAVGASLAAGISVPLADNYGLGWRVSLGVWAILALIAFFVWLPQLSRLKKSEEKRSFPKAMKSLGQSGLAWKIALFMGLQSLTFYVILAWLPAILQSRGYDAEFSGWMLSLSQAAGILGSLVVPTLAGRKNDQRGIVWFLIIVEVIGLVGLLFPQIGLVPVWVSLIGFVLGGTFGLALLFLVLRSQNAESATELSGMAQSIGYIVAATGPIIFGSIFDFTGSWTYSLLLLILFAALKLYMGLGSGRPGKV
ncbi:MFS transporter [Arenibacter sp. TNZ]|uniref:CynX/NimT family MFS transporter n=1 Tax=Arenibacter TaxID=178469 RepID=UPI000CD3CDD6|nr:MULTISPECIES: MFS transporter [Arenibacter]MCM4172354.1 MFS transporter [Arenibacter sp. TNZ]